MATRYAVADGNWSATATWDGGTLPGIGDDVYANGFTVIIDQDITVTKISTEVCPTTSIGGGQFRQLSTRYLTCDVVAGLTICFYSNAGTVNIIGDVIGGSAANAYGVRAANYGTVFIIGNVTGGSGSGAVGLFTYYSYNVTIIGNVTGGSYSTAYGVNMATMTNGYKLDVTGNITANAASGAYLLRDITVFGNLTASLYNNAVKSLGLSSYTPEIIGNLYNSTAYLAIAGFVNLKITAGSDMVWRFYDTDDNEEYLYTANAFNPPAESDVRESVEYGSSAYTGTLAVPPPSTVNEGVPTDDTVGTYALSGDLISRLGKCATTEEVDSTVAAYNS